MAGVTVIVPAAIAASVATSDGAGSHGSSLLAMAGSPPAAKAGLAVTDAGIPRMGAARREVSSLGVQQVLAEHTAEKTAARRAAKWASSGNSGSSASSPAQPSGSPQQIARAMLGSYGWSSSQFGCLRSLWNAESEWNVYASNPSGAYGIPQALPGAKMASAGPDWQSNPATQIRWGLGYIKGLYGSPCGAWAHEEADGWY
jgi:hypothetical protein